MVDELCLDLMYYIANEGLTDENAILLTNLAKTMTKIEKLDNMNAMLLLIMISGFSAPPHVQFWLDALKTKILNDNVGDVIEHGRIIDNTQTTTMNKLMATKEENMSILLDGTVRRETIYAVQPQNPAGGEHLFNDYFQKIFNDIGDAAC